MDPTCPLPYGTKVAHACGLFDEPGAGCNDSMDDALGDEARATYAEANERTVR